jgi:hypothetical protein
MVRLGSRLHSRWVAASALAGTFILLGDLVAGIVVLVAWAPPTLALLALQVGAPFGSLSPHRRPGRPPLTKLR